MILPESLSSDFVQRGYASINVLEQFPQCQYWSESVNSLPDDQWLYIVKNNRLEQDFKTNQRDQVESNYQIAREDYDNGKFTFAFSRIVANDDSLSVPVFKEIHNLFTTRFKGIAGQISGRSLEKMSVFYITRFDKGDFLTTHCDSGNSVGIVLNLSIDWCPEHGGLTVLVPQKDELSGLTHFPALGNTFIFDVSERKILHFVSEVTANRPNKRISVVARYD